MRISPLEIRKKTFEKQIRGYDKEEVEAFLLSLSHEWENAIVQIKTLETTLKKAEKDVIKHREVETSLYKTLKTAEDTGVNMIDHAKKTANLHLKETQVSAEILLNESKSKAKNIVDDAEKKAKNILEEADYALKELARVYTMLEDYRDSTLNELSSLSTTTLQKVQKVIKNVKHFDLENYLTQLRKRRYSPKTDKEYSKKLNKKPSPSAKLKSTIKMKEGDTLESKETRSGSFFDELD